MRHIRRNRYPAKFSFHDTNERKLEACKAAQKFELDLSEILRAGVVLALSLLNERGREAILSLK